MDFPRSTPVIYWATALILIGGFRLLLRSFYHSAFNNNRLKAVIYGAGVGRQLLNALFHGGKYQTVVFVDDAALAGTVIHGISVYGSSQLPALTKEFAISYVFLAMPSATSLRRRDIIDQLEHLPVYVKNCAGFCRFNVRFDQS